MESVRAIERMTVVQLRELAREKKVRLPYGVNKAQIVQLLSAKQEHAAQADEPETEGEIGLYKPKPLGYYNEEYGTSNPVVPRLIKAGLLGVGQGVLEVQTGGYGFLRASNCSPGPEDIYVSIAQIRRFSLRSGDHVVGRTREKRVGDRYNALMYIDSVNGDKPEIARVRRPFDTLTPIHPNRRLTLESPAGESDMSMRLLDFIAPIGLGQRALIVAPPKAGKTVLLKKIAQAIRENHPDIELIVLLIDERPEEVTDFRRSVDAQIVYSTFDAPQENHVRVTDMVYERAQRLVEQGKHVVVLMDSLTRLARANRLIHFETAQCLLDDGKAAEIVLFDLKLQKAVKAEDSGNVMSMLSTPEEKFDDVIGADDAKEELRFEKDPESMDRKELEKLIADVQKKMQKAAAELNFEAAAELRDKMIELKQKLNELDE